jgi:hypothetical protein
MPLQTEPNFILQLANPVADFAKTVLDDCSGRKRRS